MKAAEKFRRQQLLLGLPFSLFLGTTDVLPTEPHDDAQTFFAQQPFDIGEMLAPDSCTTFNPAYDASNPSYYSESNSSIAWDNPNFACELEFSLQAEDSNTFHTINESDVMRGWHHQAAINSTAGGYLEAFPNAALLTSASSIFDSQVPLLQDNITESESSPSLHGIEKKGRRIACLRCRMQHKSCHPNPDNLNGPCMRCVNSANNKKHRHPCFPDILSSVDLIGQSDHPRPRPLKSNIKKRNSASKNITEICITQNMGCKPYTLEVSELAPGEGDAVARTRETECVAQPFQYIPYTIVNLKKAGKMLFGHVNETVRPVIYHCISKKEKLLRMTYDLTFRYSQSEEVYKEERTLLQDVLRLWNACRMQSCSERICNGEIPCMRVPFSGPDFELPPAPFAQIKLIIIADILQPTQKRVLKLLGRLTKKSQRLSWFTIYLAVFILLHNYALLIDANGKKAKQQGLSDRFFHQPVVKSIRRGAETLLAYFHYYDEMMSHPLTTDCSSLDKIEQAGFNSEQAQFIKTTVEEVNKMSPLFQKIRTENRLEHEYYYLLQLFHSG